MRSKAVPKSDLGTQDIGSPWTLNPGLPPRRHANVRVWTRVNLSETMPGPVSPMGWSLLETGMRVMFRPLRISNDSGYSLFAFHYGRVYWDLTPVFGSRFLFRRLDAGLEMIGPSVRPVFEALRRSGRVHPRPVYSIPQKLILGLQALFAIPRIAAHLALNGSIDPSARRSR